MRGAMYLVLACDLATAPRTDGRGALAVFVRAPRHDHLLQQLQRGQPLTVA